MRVVMIPFSSTWRMLVPSAMNTLPSTPTAMPETKRSGKLASLLKKNFFVVEKFLIAV
jgi:hypothetical protein